MGAPRRWRRSAFVVRGSLSCAIIAAFAAAACFDASDLTGGSVDAEDAAAIDAGADTAIDSPADVVVADAGSSVGFCASRGDAGDTLCADFDEGSLLSGWTGIGQSGPADGSVIELSDASFVSAPSSAHSWIVANGSTAYLHVKPIATVSDIVVDTNVMVPVSSAPGYIEILVLTQYAGEFPVLTLRQNYPAGTVVEETYVGSGDAGRIGGGNYALSQAIQPGMWTHVQMHVAITSPPMLTVTLGSTVVLQQQLAAASKWTTGNMSLDQGLTHAAGFPGAVEVFFDNVALDLH